MTIFLDEKPVKGLVDTGTDATIFSTIDAKAFLHWKLKDGPTITELGSNSTSKTTVHPVHWKDFNGNQGRYYPIVSDASPAPFWDRIYYKKWARTLLLMIRSFMST